MRIWMTGLAILLAIGGVLFFALGPQRTTSITLTFHAKMGDDPLVFDEFVYENPSGPGTFRVRVRARHQLQHINPKTSPYSEHVSLVPTSNIIFSSMMVWLISQAMSRAAVCLT